MPETQATQENQEATPQFNIQRIYTKDVSFEAPNSPDVFQKTWSPEIKLELDTQSKELSPSVFEVVLTLTVTAQGPDEVAFLCEVQQAGIFTISGFSREQIEHSVSSYCPNILFPYARELISSLVTRGTFPQLNLAPVNFDAIYQQHLQQKAMQQEAPNSIN